MSTNIFHSFYRHIDVVRRYRPTRALGKAGQVLQSHVEDGHQAEKQKQVGRVSAQFVPLPEVTSWAARLPQMPRVPEPGYALGGGHFLVKRPAALAATIAP
jgi:hypothetical protein